MIGLTTVLFVTLTYCVNCEFEKIGWNVGSAEGIEVGLPEGITDGKKVGMTLGCSVGMFVG